MRYEKRKNGREKVPTYPIASLAAKAATRNAQQNGSDPNAEDYAEPTVHPFPDKRTVIIVAPIVVVVE